MKVKSLPAGCRGVGGLGHRNGAVAVVNHGHDDGLRGNGVVVHAVERAAFGDGVSELLRALAQPLDVGLAVARAVVPGCVRIAAVALGRARNGARIAEHALHGEGDAAELHIAGRVVGHLRDAVLGHRRAVGAAQRERVRPGYAVKRWRVVARRHGQRLAARNLKGEGVVGAIHVLERQHAAAVCRVHHPRRQAACAVVGHFHHDVERLRLGRDAVVGQAVGRFGHGVLVGVHVHRARGVHRSDFCCHVAVEGRGGVGQLAEGHRSGGVVGARGNHSAGSVQLVARYLRGELAVFERAVLKRLSWPQCARRRLPPTVTSPAS